jgi:anti-sigma-K factor RskA
VNPEIHALTGAYALDALDDIERAAFERHLAECPACDQEVRELRETATRLGRASAVRPSPQLREQVLAQVAATRQAPPHAPTPHRKRTTARSWYLRAGAAVAAAAVVAAVVFGVEWTHTRNQLHQARADISGISAVLGAQDARTSHGSNGQGGSGMAVASANKDRTVVMISHLPDLPQGRGYELWLMGPYGAQSAGMLQPASGDGDHMHPVVAQVPQGTQKVGVSVEPAGGSPQPTTTPVLVFPLA